MKALLVATLLLGPCTAALAQPAPAPVVTSALLGVPLPVGATLSRNGLYRSAARMSLKMDAGKRQLTLGESLEIYKVPLDAPWQPEFLASLQGAGWTVTPDATDATLAICERAGTSYLLDFEPGKRDRWIYVVAIAPAGAPVMAADPSAGVAPTGSAPVAPPIMPPAEPQLPASPAVPPPATPAAPVAPTPTAPMMTVQSAPSRGGVGTFTFTSTNFADGWVAVDEPEYVKATRGPITAYLFRRVRMTSEMRPPVIVVEEYFWNRDVVPRYDVPVIEPRRAELEYLQTDFREGEATERATGRHVYIGMYVHKDVGGGLNILIVAPDRATYNQLYPKVVDVEPTLGVNQFPVGAADVPGYWSESSSTGIDMFYSSTGMYAGRNSTASSNEFTFNADGTYTSKHAGTSASNGANRVYQSKYAGRWNMIGNWQMALTNRYDGHTETFAVRFESVSGGRILHLQNVAASALQYHLGRER